MKTKNNVVYFYAYLLISFLLVFASFINDHYITLSYAALSLLLISLYHNKKKYYAIINLVILLLLMSLFTMILELHGFTGSMVTRIGVRDAIINETSLEISIFITSVSVLTLSAFLFVFDDRTYVYRRLPRNIDNIGRRKKYFVWAAIIVLSFLSNLTTNIFEESYSEQKTEVFITGAWNAFFILVFSYYLVLTKLRSTEDLIFTAAIIAFWLLHGNRGEIFPILFWILVYRYSIVKRVNFSKLFIVVFVVVLAIAFNTVGTVRGMSGDRAQLFYEFFVGTGSAQTIDIERTYSSTAGASAYSLTAMVDGVATGDYPIRYGRTYVDYVNRTLPLIIIPDRPETLEEMLYRDARTLGGNNYAGEPFLNFYVFGPFLYSIFVGGIVLWLQRRSRTSVRAAVYSVAISMLAPRIAWYGFIYVYKMILLFLAVEVFFFVKSGFIDLRAKRRSPELNSL